MAGWLRRSLSHPSCSLKLVVYRRFLFWMKVNLARGLPEASYTVAWTSMLSPVWPGAEALDCINRYFGLTDYSPLITDGPQKKPDSTLTYARQRSRGEEFAEIRDAIFYLLKGHLCIQIEFWVSSASRCSMIKHNRRGTTCWHPAYMNWKDLASSQPFTRALSSGITYSLCLCRGKYLHSRPPMEGMCQHPPWRQAHIAVDSSDENNLTVMFVSTAVIIPFRVSDGQDDSSAQEHEASVLPDIFAESDKLLSPDACCRTPTPPSPQDTGVLSDPYEKRHGWHSFLFETSCNQVSHRRWLSFRPLEDDKSTETKIVCAVQLCVLSPLGSIVDRRLKENSRSLSKARGQIGNAGSAATPAMASGQSSSTTRTARDNRTQENNHRKARVPRGFVFKIEPSSNTGKRSGEQRCVFLDSIELRQSCPSMASATGRMVRHLIIVFDGRVRSQNEARWNLSLTRERISVDALRLLQGLYCCKSFLLESSIIRGQIFGISARPVLCRQTRDGSVALGAAIRRTVKPRCVRSLAVTLQHLPFLAGPDHDDDQSGELVFLHTIIVGLSTLQAAKWSADGHKVR
ncbi:uncharacterized protein CLUP02_12422 [Colletotrichum lupini]|uniref:Uncharacterized protein n=1 Tax=Colletotrichum lupini TaxID=145971 RepID=A0A9Q8T179_9PEZI|nr:uncharacterized protein CLUP02_12422 [Colletotrichum lupini]UQC86920.1 hypothetical protein CLUP02_12422 [Colletotrichum lupini]